jgi:hypothetical protein
MSLTITVSDTDLPLDQIELPSVPARLRLTFGWLLVQSLPLQVCKALPLRDLHTLSITYPEATWSAADWMDVYSHCPKVTYLRVRASWAFTLVPTLKKCNIFPSLVTLSLRDINFFTSLSVTPEGPEPLCTVLPEILRVRSNAGIPVRRLDFTSCVLTDLWLKSLREVVDDIVLDLNRYDCDSRSSSGIDYDSWSDDYYSGDGHGT